MVEPENVRFLGGLCCKKRRVRAQTKPPRLLSSVLFWDFQDLGA